MYFSFSCRSICLFVPQQHKLMGSSAQNSSGVQWCRSRVRFNEVPEKVPKVPEKVLPEKVPEKVPGGFGGSGSTRFRRRFRRRFRNALVQRWARFNEGSSRFRCDSRSVSAQFLDVFRSISSQFRMNNSVKTNFCCCWGYRRSLLL